MVCYTWLFISTKQAMGRPNNNNKTFKHADILCLVLVCMSCVCVSVCPVYSMHYFPIVRLSEKKMYSKVFPYASIDPKLFSRLLGTAIMNRPMYRIFLHSLQHQPNDCATNRKCNPFNFPNAHHDDTKVHPPGIASTSCCESGHFFLFHVGRYLPKIRSTSSSAINASLSTPMAARCSLANG